MIRLGPPRPARVVLLCAGSLTLALVPVVAAAIAAPKPVRSSARSVAKTEFVPRYAPLSVDLVTQVKRTALGDDRFHQFLAASTGKGHRTIQSFTVERRDLRTARGRIVAAVSFSMPATRRTFRSTFRARSQVGEPCSQYSECESLRERLALQERRRRFVRQPSRIDQLCSDMD